MSESVRDPDGPPTATPQHRTHSESSSLNSLDRSSKFKMDIIKSVNLRKAGGSTKPATEVTSGKDVICFYFSAHWCPPCRAFTPVLKEFYEVCLPTNKENKLITLCPISSHIFGDIDTKPSRGDRPRSNLGGEGCDQLPGVTSCQL